MQDFNGGNPVYLNQAKIFSMIPPQDQKTPVSAEGPDNNDLLIRLAEKFCANDPEMEYLIVHGNSEFRSYTWELDMLRKISNALKGHVITLRAATESFRWKASLSENVIPFPQRGGAI